MKHFYLLLLLCAFSWGARGKVLVVDNNEGTGAEYRTINEAINSASNGDSIYVHASAKDYGNISVNKKISLFGPGHYPESTGYLPAELLTVTLKNGSSGSLITGFRVRKIECEVWNVVEDITIENNFFPLCANIYGPYGDRSDGDNWIIQGNIFVEGPNCGGNNMINVRESASGNDGWIIANNLFITKTVQNNTGVFGDLNATTTVINNTIIHRNSAVLFYSNSATPDSNHALLKNNIIVSLSSSFTDVAAHCNNCSWENNLTYSPRATLVALPGNANINNTDPGFVNVPDSYEWDYDNDFNVSESSAASGAGSDGTDLGAYGARFNFNKYGYPFGLPVVEAFQIENQLLHSGENLRFTIKARAADNRSE